MKTPTISQSPLNQFGSLEGMVRGIRAQRQLDLHAPRWRAAHPRGTHAQWRADARACLLGGMHLLGGSTPLNPSVDEVRHVDGLHIEAVAFDAGPGTRVEGFFVLPENLQKPVPGLLLCHAWGGPFIFGKDRVVDSGRDHPLLAEYRASCTDGEYLAHVFARAGYAVLVTDNFFFGSRIPRGVGGIPDTVDPFALSMEEAEQLQASVASCIYLGVKQLQWAGTTWTAVNLRDDTCALDYLASRPEVDAERLGCTGLSVGGWRTNMMAALDDRIKASVSVGWMTTADHQQLYNVNGAVGSFCLLPGVWNRLDIPDVAVMGAPCASMVVLGERDPLFPQEAKVEALQQIADGYAWAGCPERTSGFTPDTDHCYNHIVQREALAWFSRFL